LLVAAMKLTTFTDYSLRVLMHLATQPDRRATVADIAQAFGVKENHLTKVVHFLGRQGWPANVRGRGGGLGLAVAPWDIAIGQLMRETEGESMPAECFDDDAGHCAITHVCLLRGVLREAVDAFYGALDRYTLADLVQNRSALSKVLFMRPAGERPASR